MNRRQRKKKSKQQITVFIGCDKAAKAEDYRKMKESIEYQLRAGSAVLLPAYKTRVIFWSARDKRAYADVQQRRYRE